MEGPKSNRIIFIASFLTLIAEGVGFGIRAGILGDWGTQFGFTKTDLGTITGGGLVGFGVTIIICSFFIDRVGYKPLLLAAFLLHASSAVVTLAATPVFNSMGGADGGPAAKNAAYWCLYIGMFMFALANGLCEAVINPLVATLYSKQKTHYLNILHAGWPAGLVIGGLGAYCFVGNDAAIVHLHWEIPMAIFLLPTLAYGILTIIEKFPVSEAKAAGVSFGEMLAQFASPLLLLLLLIQAMVGYVELGTDSWISNITGNVIGKYSLLLFVYTSSLMFTLRFFAGPIVERINPLGLLFVAACFGCAGLLSLSFAGALLTMFAAATIYAIGKTFYWPTMLGVVGERFPKGGAITMGMMGGIGMLSAGLLGGPVIGYKQDYFASKQLEQEAPAIYQRYVSSEKNSVLLLPAISGLDGKKVGELADAVQEKEKTGKPLTVQEASDKKHVLDHARMYGGRMALRLTAIVPAIMAFLYLMLVLYFRATGGYKAIHLAEVTGPTEY